MENKLGFVILNFNGDKVTIDCVDSLLKFYPDSTICIIDNNSEKNPIDNILNCYKDNDKVKILKADKNYGFAIGNNIGINYLRENGFEYIAVINNDTIFQNDGLLKEIKTVQDDEAVLSLELDNKDGTKQLPYGLIKGASKSYIKLGVLQLSILTRMFYVYKFFKNLLKRKKKTETTQAKAVEIDFSKYDYIISGAAYILTPAFFKYYSQLFNKTFLYCEEHIMTLYLKKAKLKTRFVRDTKIIHLESQTAQLTNFSMKKIKLGFASWWKGLRVFFKSHKKIARKYSNKNYKYEILK